MKTIVVNVRSYTCTPPLPFIYVGRYMPGLFAGHPLANPFKLSRKDQRDPAKRAECLEAYRNWLLPDHEAELRQLAERVRQTNKSLGCWCHPASCHADILAEYIDLILAGESLR